MPAQPDVSVIIGAYNAMPYISRTLESVVAQSLGIDRMEVLVVDDGSTDGTLGEAQRFAAEYPSVFRVFSQENSGSPAAPRNRGIDEAQGRFIFFLDADDYLGTDALQRMLALADENRTDIVLGRLVGLNRRVPVAPFQSDLSRTDVFSSAVFSSLGPMKLIRRSLIDKLGVRFPLGLPSREEHVVMAALMIHADGISVLSSYDCVYIVGRDDGGGLTRGLRRVWPGRLAATEAVIDQILADVEPGKRQDALLARLVRYDLLKDARAFCKDRRKLKNASEVRARIIKLADKAQTRGVSRRLTLADRLRWILFRRRQYDRFLRLTKFLSQRNPDRALEGGIARMGWPR